MILDGYNEHGEVGWLRFDYRPALVVERCAVSQGLKFHRSKEVVTSFVERHITWCNHPLSVLSGEDLETLFHICLGLAKPDRGSRWTRGWERADAQNLYDGVILALRHPIFDKRKCSDCKKWWYDDETGKVKKKNGRELLRPLDTVLLCQTHDGCPKGTPEKIKSLYPKNRLAFKHYQECKAVGQFPDDPIVRRNAWIIERALKVVK
jgi:hypothetical protein